MVQERHPPRTGPFRFRPAYVDLVCHKCNRVDKFAALTRGISDEFRLPHLKGDAITTGDSFLIVTRRMHDALAKVPGLELHTFTVPSSPEYLVLFPKQQFHPPPEARLYTYMAPHVKTRR